MKLDTHDQYLGSAALQIVHITWELIMLLLWFPIFVLIWNISPKVDETWYRWSVLLDCWNASVWPFSWELCPLSYFSRLSDNVAQQMGYGGGYLVNHWITILLSKRGSSVCFYYLTYTYLLFHTCQWTPGTIKQWPTTGRSHRWQFLQKHLDTTGHHQHDHVAEGMNNPTHCIPWPAASQLTFYDNLEFQIGWGGGAVKSARWKVQILFSEIL